MASRAVAFLLALSAAVGCGRTRHEASSATTSPSREVAADLGQRLARWKPVPMPFAMEKLAPRERQLVEKLIEVCRRAETIYWLQGDPEGMALYESLSDKPDSPDAPLRRFLWINGGRWDLLDENRPFVGREPMPPGHAFYPKDLTRAEVESYVAAHPEEKAAIYGERTVVRRKNGRLAAIPYREEYRNLLERAAAALREASRLSDDPAFARFLILRADALLSDDYYASDVAWLELADPKFDLILAPYETYLDELLGVKGSFGAAVLVRNDAESEKLAIFRKYVPEIQDSLPLPREDRPSLAGKAAPMEVMDAPFRSGDLRHGYQAVADNLPNDPKIHEEHGSKRIFFKNFLDARVAEIIIPLARRLLREEDAAKASARGYLVGTLLHEIAHGLGPAFARVNGKQVSIREAIGAPFSALEEAKADTTGMAALSFLAARGVVPADEIPEAYSSFVSDLFRTVRFGTGEAHARAEMMEFNFLVSEKAITRGASGRYAIDIGKMPAAFAKLSKELLEIEAAGDRSRAQAWFAKYDTMPADLAASLKSLTDVPVDIDPQVPFPEPIR
ncbi:MAG TPA: Zn-dependent hydrolase [Thermoanaerobaculia bacterium]|nr:Zn-dependent hydrolase [Thermoanaerobaculia bacterium]